MSKISYAKRAKLFRRMATIGLDKAAYELSSSVMNDLVDSIKKAADDDKPRHYVLFMFTRETVDDDGNLSVTSDVVSSMPEVDMIIDFVGDWLTGAVRKRRNAGR